MSTPGAIPLHLRANPEFFLPLCMPCLFLQENLSPCSGRESPRIPLGWWQWPGLQDTMDCTVLLNRISQIPRRDSSRLWPVWSKVCVREAWAKLFLASVSSCVSNISLNAFNFKAVEIKRRWSPPWLTVFIQWPAESMQEASVKYVTLLRFYFHCQWPSSG